MISHLVDLCKECKITDFNITDIASSALVKSPGSTQRDSLIIEMQSVYKKNQFYAQKKLLKKCKERVFVNESLTKVDSQIFRKSRADVKNGKLFATWTNNCKVWAKSSDKGTPFCLSDGANGE